MEREVLEVDFFVSGKKSCCKKSGDREICVTRLVTLECTFGNGAW